MAKIVTLEVSDNLYELLLQVAGQIEQTPEQLLVEWIENKIKQSLNDPLLQLAGAFESDLTDISERHDTYIGVSLSGHNG